LDCNTLGVNGSQVGVLKEGDEVSLSSFLKSHNGRGLEAEVGLEDALSANATAIQVKPAYLEVLSNLTNKTLEGEFADEQLGRLLVSPDFTERDGTGAEAMGLLHTTSCSL
jgi:hypothetical protein